MKILITAGPTCEPMDRVRRLTNFSTGRLGWELASFFQSEGHEVILLLSESATIRSADSPFHVIPFSTTEDLAAKLENSDKGGVEAIFHAAAVSDFKFGRIWKEAAGGRRIPCESGKITTKEGPVLAELLPTPKIIRRLRQWHPKAFLVGWKYEVEGGRDNAVQQGQAQIHECETDLSVVNGPAYGEGFGIVAVDRGCGHHDNRTELFEGLRDRLAAWKGRRS